MIIPSGLFSNIFVDHATLCNVYYGNSNHRVKLYTLRQGKFVLIYTHKINKIRLQKTQTSFSINLMSRTQFGLRHYPDIRWSPKFFLLKQSAKQSLYLISTSYTKQMLSIWPFRSLYRTSIKTSFYCMKCLFTGFCFYFQITKTEFGREGVNAENVTRTITSTKVKFLSRTKSVSVCCLAPCYRLDL